MSTILRALRRLEREKSRPSERPLREQVATGSEPARRFPVALVVIAVFAVGIGLGAGALLFWPQRIDEAPTAAQDVAAAAEASRPRPVPAAAEASRPHPVPAAAERSRPRELAAAARPRLAPPAPPPAPPVEPEPAPAAEALARETGPAPAAEALAGQTGQPARELALAEPPPAVEVAREPARPEPALPGEALSSDVEVVRRIAPPPLEIRHEEWEEPRPPQPGEVRPGAEALRPRKTAARQGPPEAPPAPRAEAEPPPLPAESPFPSERSAVPVILVSRTQWHPEAERREALIEVETDAGPEAWRVHEGDSVGPLVVERIEPSGVIFLYEDVQLRHAVGGE